MTTGFSSPKYFFLYQTSLSFYTTIMGKIAKSRGEHTELFQTLREFLKFREQQRTQSKRGSLRSAHVIAMNSGIRKSQHHH
ncbi:hypothetical protein M0802_009730 [Mischocyttarus mexicanus]|nr:hypothetical protein M0802_009730 [Mischocyttarus mexicanus]